MHEKLVDRLEVTMNAHDYISQRNTIYDNPITDILQCWPHVCTVSILIDYNKKFSLKLFTCRDKFIKVQKQGRDEKKKTQKGYPMSIAYIIITIKCVMQ